MTRPTTRLLSSTAFLLALTTASTAWAEVAEAWRNTGFHSPESVEWDEAAGLAYVSNMGADPMAADGDGHISTIGADGVVINASWVSGLNAPKGMAATGGKLYAADLTELVEIDIASAAVVNRYPAPGSVMLNDVAAAPDGRIFVSDTFGNSVWVLEGGAMSIFVQDPALMGANGLTVVGGALIVANLGDASEGFDKIKPGWVVSVDMATKAVTPYGSADPSGVLDGVEPDGKGGVIFTDYMGGRLMQQAPGGSAAELAKLEMSAADLDFVPQQGLILVPITGVNTVVGLKWSD